MIDYELDTKCFFEGTEYHIIDVLENMLLLVVKKQDIDDKKFPIQTFVVPDIRR